MRYVLLGLLFAAGAFGALSTAEAQSGAKDPRPGYLILRVLNDAGATTTVDPNNPQAQPKGDPTRSVAAVIPYTSIEYRLLNTERSANPIVNPNWPMFRHRHGIVFFYSDTTFIQAYLVRGFSYEKLLKEEFDKWALKRTYDGIQNICEKALMFGQVDEAFKYCNAYFELPKTADRLPQTNQYKEFAKAYDGLQEKLSANLPPNPKAEEWKSTIGAQGIVQGTHYAVLYFNSNQIGETKRRLSLLDANFKAFYLWHALKGIALPMPKHKLLAIQCDETTQVRQFRDGLDGLPIVSDAFYSPSHDLLVLSPERMDASGAQFMSLTRGRWTGGYNRDELIRGRMPAIQPAEGKAAEAVQAQALATAEQFIIEEADKAAISREGSRQLMAVTGVLPPHIRLPIWLEQGLGFYFQRPKGPVYVQKPNGFNMIVGLVTGYGAPNFEQHRAFDTFKADFNRDPANTLDNVVAGWYHQGAQVGQDFDPPPPPAGVAPGAGGVGAPPIPSISSAGLPPDDDPNEPAGLRRIKAQLKSKADAASWALVYYLQNTRISGLKRFYDEMAKMPRDLQLQDETIMKVFCRCFGLVDVTGEIDPRAVKTFAEGWLAYIGNLQHFDYEVPLDAATLDPFAAANVGVVGAAGAALPQPPIAQPGQPGQPGTTPPPP